MNPVQLLLGLPILIYSAILHEIMHGVVADRLGDPTARLSGRLTLNPIPHIDLYMTILVPIITYWASGGTVIFGGAKPVPIDPYNLKEGKKDIALVALSGPLTNLALAAVAAGGIHLLVLLPAGNVFGLIAELVLQVIVQINVLLAVFNLLPIPPLDGSKVFALLLPDGLSDAYLNIGSIGIIILFLLLSFPIGPFYLPTFMTHIYTTIFRLLGL